MKISTIFYSLKQGFINLKRNKLFTLASIGTIAACVFLIGLFYSVLVNLQHIVSNAEKNVSIAIFFNEDATDEQIKAIGDAIKKRAEFGTIRYISPEEAWENYKEEYFVRVLEENVTPETKWVEGSNYVDVNVVVDERTNRVIMMGAMDNLVKGAAGQAVQNMNLMFGLAENTGLQLVPMFP